MRATDRLFAATGGSGLYDGNAMRQQFHAIRPVGANLVNSCVVARTNFTKAA